MSQLRMARSVRVGMRGKPIVRDSFTAADSTNLNGRRPELTRAGATYSALTGSWDINGNAARHSATASGLIAADCGSADIIYEVTITPENTTANAGAYFRVTDANNGWLVRWRHGSNQIQIIERNAGTPTTRATAALTPVTAGAAYTIRIEAKAAVITATVPGSGVTATYASATFNQTATQVGFAGGTATGAKFDNMTVRRF